MCIAAHFDILFQKSLLKKEIKKQVLEKLVDLNILSPARPVAETLANDVPSTSAEVWLQSIEEPAVLVTPLVDHAEKSAPATLPCFDPFAPSSSLGSSLDSKLKVSLTCLQLEAQETEQAIANKQCFDASKNISLVRFGRLKVTHTSALLNGEPQHSTAQEKCGLSFPNAS